MRSFLLDLAKGSDEARTVIVVDESGVEHPRQYQLRPRRLLYVVGGGAVVLAALLVALIVLTPLRVLVFGPDPEELRETARVNIIRAAALEDSLALQNEYLARLRSAIVGDLDEEAEVAAPVDTVAAAPEGRALEAPPASRSDDWADHEQPALALGRLAADRRATLSRPATEAYLASLQFPTLPPVEGFFARGFDAARGHYGIDEAVEEGTPVRSIGDGYVIFADWTNDGGYVVAVQHADGYLSVYKHNSRLLKRVGDRVRNREAVALSGNTGEITTGPHLHFELWRNGLAQDPRLYLIDP
jgi:murein DD-endopeptidase MepM/ murein hydrolase activator NlpD